MEFPWCGIAWSTTRSAEYHHMLQQPSQVNQKYAKMAHQDGDSDSQMTCYQTWSSCGDIGHHAAGIRPIEVDDNCSGYFINSVPGHAHFARWKPIPLLQR
jgi:hypothetical protein